MTNENIKEFRRVGGKSAQNLAQDVGQKLKDEAPSEKLQKLSTGELTAELWNDLQGTWVGNKGWNIIAVPSQGSTPESTGDFRLLVAPYIETLSFQMLERLHEIEADQSTNLFPHWNTTNVLAIKTMESCCTLKTVCF